MAQTDTNPEPEAPVSLAGWKKNKVHTITLPSGSVVKMQIPDLPTLIKTEVIPNELVDVAIAVAKDDKEVTRDDIIKQADFYNRLASIAVVEPKVTEEDFASGSLPFEDKELIVEIATRQRDIDAIGHHIGGLEKVRDWRSFRGLSLGIEDLEG